LTQISLFGDIAHANTPQTDSFHLLDGREQGFYSSKMYPY